jgi:hypothetical protein
MSLPLDIAALQFGSNRVKGESAFVQKGIDRIGEDGAAGIFARRYRSTDRMRIFQILPPQQTRVVGS